MSYNGAVLGSTKGGGKTMKKASVLVALVALLSLAILTWNCSSSSNDEIRDYVTAADDFTRELTLVMAEVRGFYETKDMLGASEVVAQCGTYMTRYEQFLGEFLKMECPAECVQLRQHLVDAVVSLRRELVETAVAHSSADVHSPLQARSYRFEAGVAVQLAGTESSRLRDEFD